MASLASVERLEDRTLLTAPELVSITPNVGAFYVDGDVRHESPDEFVVKFSPGQVIDDATVAGGIQVTRGGANQTLGDADDVTVPIGYAGVDPNNSNLVVVRFAETLPDDVYRVTVVGTGANPLTNDAGEAFNNGADATLDFELDLGAKVVSVVPQPVTRDASLIVDATTLTHGDRFAVSVRGVTQIVGLRLDTQPALTGVDVEVSYTASESSNEIATNIATAVDLISGVNATAAGDVVTIGGDTFSPEIAVTTVDSSALVLSDAGLRRRADQIVVYFNNDDLLDDASSAENPNFYQLHFTNDTISNRDDTVHLPVSIDYDPVSDTAVLTFGAAIDTLSGAGAYRLRIGNAEQIGIAPLATAVGDAGDTFATAMTSVGDLSNPANLSQLLSASIDAQFYALAFPGAQDEPGHRDIPHETHLNGDADTTPGITQQFYNFRVDYGIDPSGNQLQNLITENQKQRAREIFEIYGNLLGIDFIETPAQGLIVATGDLRAISDTIPTGPGGVAGLAGANDFMQPLAVMDNAESWTDEYGGNWFDTAMHEIGHLLGLGHTYDLPPGTVMGDESALGSGPREPVFPGPHDVVHGQNLYRPESKDIDLYRFTIAAGQRGLFSAETIAERLSNSSTLDTHLRLYQELAASAVTRFADSSNLEVTFTAAATGPAGNQIQLNFAQSDRGAAGGVGVSVLGSAINIVLNTNAADISTAKQVVDAIAGNGAAAALVTATVTEGDENTKIGTNSLTETSLRLSGGDRILLAQNDDYFSEDSSIELFLESGTYYIGVSASGNDQYDPTVPDSGLGGTSQGNYQLSLSFRPDVSTSIVDTTGVSLDGDSDNVPGGVFNFWFQAVPDANTLVVDRLAADGGDGSLATPFNRISDAFAAATDGDVVRIVGNGGADADLDTLDDNLAYQIGRDAINGLPLRDGSTMDVPHGVTVQIDAGAILQFRRAKIGVGSSSSVVDRSRGALQVLGTPGHNVFMTSYNDGQTGVDENPLATAPSPGDWGGIVFQNDFDRAESRFDYTQEGIFLNWVNHADIRYGGGHFVVDSVDQTFSPIHMIEAHPTISHNRIQFSADAGMSADPNSFREYTYRSPRFQAADPFTPDYGRVGPDIHDNLVINNSINGLFVNIETPAGGALKELTVPGRFDDTDIVHVISENLIIAGTPGGPVVDATGPDVSLVTLAPVNGGSLPNATYHYQLVFVDADGNESPPSGTTPSITLSGADGSVLLSNLPVATGQWVGRRLYRSSNGVGGPFNVAAELNANSRTFTDNGSLTGGLLAASPRRARMDARLRIDPNVVVKLDGGRIEVGIGAQFIAEGHDGQSVVLTSLQDDTFGAGGSFDSNNNLALSAPSPGNWGGVYFSPMSTGSIDEAVIQYGGGVTRVGGSFKGFNTIEIYQADVRLTNTFFFDNGNGTGGQGPANRDGLGANSPAVVFVRGAQPIIVNNVFQDSPRSGVPAFDPAISINVNSLNHDLVVDSGRSTGAVDRFAQYTHNQGPLLRRNFMDLFGLNGMVVRAETLMTQSVWDDTDIVHIVRDEMYIPDFHTYGGLRFESDPAQSLVVKLLGASAGFTANGRPLDIDDRIGGAFQVVGQPGFPVVFTSLFDDSIGAGLDPNGRPQNDTDGTGLTSGAPGHWRSLKIERWAHDRNIGVVVENQAGNSTVNAQFIGQLASDEKSSDENLRLGYQVHGSLSQRSDVDVYSFKAAPGTEVWLDIDRTTVALDAVIELLNADGDVIARSVNSLNEDANPGLLFANTGLIPANHVNPLRKSTYFIRDNYSMNPRDPGLRVVLPGPNVAEAIYHVRVRSNSSNLSDLTAGESFGSYQLNLSLREIDEVPGAAVSFADIRYATNGIEIIGQPGHSPLLGEVTEITGNNNTRTNGQNMGNLLNSDRAALSIAGQVSGSNDIDFFQFTVSFDSTQQISGFTNPSTHGSVIFDLDYADGMGRADTVLSVFDSNGRLILISDNSNIADDRPAPNQGADLDDLSRGSVGPLDPYIGAVELPVGTYYAAVTPVSLISAQLNQFFVPNPVNPLVRLEPVNSVARIAEDHMDQAGNARSTASPAQQPVLFNDQSIVPWSIGDVALFVNDGDDTFIVDPFTGALEVTVGKATDTNAHQVRDIAMRPDGGLFGFSAYVTAGGRGQTDANSGRLIQINTGTGATTDTGDDGISTWQQDDDNATGQELRNDNPADENRVGDGMQFNAMTFTTAFSNEVKLFAVGEAGNNNLTNVPGVARSTFGQGLRNVLYEFEPDGSATSGSSADRTGAARLNGAGTNIVERGFLDTSVGGGDGGDITGIAEVGGTMFAVTDDGDLFRINAPTSTTASLAFITDLSVNFQGLVAGPDRVEEGDFSNVLYAISNTGRLFAFDTTGTPAPVFVQGQSDIPIVNNQSGTPITVGARGLAFSNLDVNLWHFSGNRANDPGHGIEPSFDGHRLPGGFNLGGTNSLYFGFQDAASMGYGGNGNPNDPGNRNNYNFPGGAHGSTISNTFSLENYSAQDLPVLYFNYFIDTEKDAYNLNQNPPGMRDALRVYVGDESGGWTLVGTNNSSRAGGLADDEYDFGSNAQTLFDIGEASAPNSWRQARVDLSGFAGQKDLRLRFDFATAGSLNMGDILTHGSELRMVDGSVLRDGDTFTIDGEVFEFDLGITLVAPTGGAISDEDFFSVTSGGTTVFFEFDEGDGLLDGTRTPILFTPTDSAAVIAQRIQTAIQGTALNGLLNLHLNDHRLNLVGATSATPTGLPATFVEGAVGVAGPNHQIVVDAGMTATDVLNATVPVLAAHLNVAGQEANTDVIKVFGEVIRVIGHPVDDAGPLLLTDSLIGDFFGAFYSNTRGQSNLFEGVYIDDIIIGLAERGEMVTEAANGADTFATNPGWNSQSDITVGEYQLEIRRAKDYGISNNDPTMTNIITPTLIGAGLTFDANQRLARQVSLAFNSGSAIGDAVTFDVSDGTEHVIVEFVDASIPGNTADPGNVPIFFDPTDSANLIAELFRNAINSQSVQNVLDLTAALSDGSVSGPAGNSNIVDLFGTAVVTGDAVTAGAVSIVDNSATLDTIDDSYGDQNLFRDQGQIIVNSSFVTDSSEFGIVVTSVVNGAGPDANGSGSTAPLAGALDNAGYVRNLRELNTQRLMTGVVIGNNVIARNADGGVHFLGGLNGQSSVAFGRIVNNTIYGAGAGIGINVEQNASPTVLNNILASLGTGIRVAGGSTAVLGGTYFQGNGTNTVGVTAGDFPIFAAAGDPLFVDAANNNFYLDSGSRAIDASIDSLGERVTFESVKAPLGIAPSPILAPEYDALGQLRIDDPSQVPPPGQGSNIFKDRGAVERADFEGPYTNLVQIDPDGNEVVYGRDETIVVFDNPPLLTEFIVQLNDDAVGIQDSIIVAAQVELYLNGNLLTEGVDYFFGYNANTDRISLTALTTFAVDNRYTIVVDNADPTGVRDLAGNYLVSNQTDGSGLNQFLILVTNGVNDPPVNTLQATAQSMLEDRTLVFNDANSNRITVSDPDAFLAPVNTDVLQITLEVANGFLTLGSTNGLAFSEGSGSGDARMVFSGTIADLNTALDGLVYLPDFDYFGTDQLVITTNDLGNFNAPGTTQEVDQDTIDITIDPVNDKPTFDLLTNHDSVEDDGAQSVNPFATNISFGPANEGPQDLTFNLNVTGVTSNLAFVSAPAIDPATGILTYEAAPNTNGVATIQVTLVDDGPGTAPDENTSDVQTFTITVAAVNDKPEFTIPATAPDVLEDAGAQSVANFATGILPGPAAATDELGQVLTFNVSSVTTSGDLAFVSAPAIDPATGTLTYETAPNTNGVATITVSLTDDGTPNETSAAQQFTLTVESVNDEPTFSLDKALVESDVNDGPQTVAAVTSGMDAGAFNETAQKLSFDVVVTGTTGTLVFSTAPAIDSATGELTYEAAADTYGTATITVNLVDDGPDAPPPNDNTSVTETLTISVYRVDYGDALDSYGTLKEPGAAHTVVDGVHLGTAIDWEDDGLPGATATGDDGDNVADEDGVIFLTLLERHDTVDLSVDLTVNASTDGFLDAWIDFNGNDVFDTGEHLFGGVSLPLIAGDNSVTFDIPAGAVAGNSVARFRFSTAGSLSATGRAADGEVEDYAVVITEVRPAVVPTITSPDGPATTDHTPTFVWSDDTGISDSYGDDANESYEIVILDASNNEVVRTGVVGTSYTAARLPDGIYTVRVRGISRIGQPSAFSTDLVLEVTTIVLATPTGSIIDATPRFDWNDIPGTSVYDLWVNNLTTGQTEVIRQTSLVGSEFTAVSSLPAGTFKAWVRAFDSESLAGDWSAPRTFTIVAPTNLRPSSTADTIYPTFQWDAVANADHYDLWVRNLTTGEDQVIRQRNLTSNSFTATTPLFDGTYRFWVRAFDTAGEAGAWSNAQTFVLDVPTPQIPSFNMSLDPLTMDRVPELSWNAVQYATEYEVLFFAIPEIPEERFTFRTTATSASVPFPLHDGIWRFRVRAYNATGEFSPYSTSIDTEIDTSLAPQLLTPGAPNGATPPTVSIGQPRFDWTDVPGAVRYDLWVRNLTTGEDQVIREQDLTDSEFTPATALPNGNYRWWVRAFNDENIGGQWSSPLTFALRETVITLVGPSGVTMDPTPTFSWRPVSSATHYDLWVRNLTTGQDQVIREEFLTTNSFTPTTPLEGGGTRYRFWVRAINGTVNFPWSAAMDFSIATNLRPTVTEPVVPDGEAAALTFDATPRIGWTALPGAATYEVYLRNLDTNGNQVFSGLTENAFSVPTELPDGRFRVWVRAFNELGQGGLWGAASDFNVDSTLKPTVTNPAGQIADATPTFEWTAVPGAAFYELAVDNLTSGQVDVIRVQNLVALNFTPASPLLPGEYQFKVRGVSFDGSFSEWSDPSTGFFEIVSLEINGGGDFEAFDTDGTIDQPPGEWPATEYLVADIAVGGVLAGDSLEFGLNQVAEPVESIAREADPELKEHSSVDEAELHAALTEWSDREWWSEAASQEPEALDGLLPAMDDVSFVSGRNEAQPGRAWMALALPLLRGGNFLRRRKNRREES